MATEIKKYLKLYWKLVKFAASIEMEYRLSFLIEIFVEVGYFFVTLFGMRVLFWNVKEVAGWNFYQLLILYGVNMIFSEILLGVVFVHNLRNLPSSIAKGELDIILTKPLNSQFAVSFWRPYFAMIPGVLAGVVTVIIGFKNLSLILDPFSLMPAILIFLSGLIIAYSFGMMVVTLSFWTINVNQLSNLAQQFLFMAKHPYSVFTGVWKIVFLTVVPIAFMVSFPTQTILGDFKLWWLPFALVLAIVFLKASNMFWDFALKKYSSASS